MHSDLLAAKVNFDLIFAVANPHRRAGVGPRYRIAVALPGYVSIASHLPQLFIDVGIRQSASDGMEFEFLVLPALIDALMCRAVHTLVRDFPDPLTQLAVQVFQARRFTALQTT